MSNELPVIESTYDLIVWVHDRVQKFPRHSRFSIGSRIENHVLQVLAHLIEAKFTREKEPALRAAGLALEQTRFLLRLAMDTRLIAISSHEFSSKKLTEISRQIQAWRKHCQVPV